MISVTNFLCTLQPGGELFGYLGDGDHFMIIFKSFTFFQFQLFVIYFLSVKFYNFEISPSKIKPSDSTPSPIFFNLRMSPIWKSHQNKWFNFFTLSFFRPHNLQFPDRKVAGPNTAIENCSCFVPKTKCLAESAWWIMLIQRVGVLVISAPCRHKWIALR